MKKKETAIKIYETTDYSAFKILKENRSITPGREKKIVSSIARYGFRFQPILCNEKLEVIDGQGRLKACEALGIPVLFIIDPAADINVCREMNSSMTNWTIEDYIISYAQEGLPEYVTVAELIAKYSQKGVNTRTVLNVATTSVTCMPEKIRSGDLYLVLSREEIEQILNWIVDVVSLVKPMQINRNAFLGALVRVSQIKKVNLYKLLQKIKKNTLEIVPASRYDQYLDLFTEIYNKNNRDEFVNIKDEYEKIKKNPWDRPKENFFGRNINETRVSNATFGKELEAA